MTTAPDTLSISASATARAPSERPDLRFVLPSVLLGPLENTPDLELRAAVVRAGYPGASTDDVTRIADALHAAGHVDLARVTRAFISDDGSQVIIRTSAPVDPAPNAEVVLRLYEAVAFVLNRAQMDSDLGYQIGPATEAFKRLCRAEAAFTGQSVDHVMRARSRATTPRRPRIPVLVEHVDALEKALEAFEPEAVARVRREVFVASVRREVVGG
jgi:hypothetical protein